MVVVSLTMTVTAHPNVERSAIVIPAIPQTIECNADEGHHCDADRTQCTDDDDEGQPCPRCKETERYWEAQYRAACRPCTLCGKRTTSDDGFCSIECREACERDYR